MRHYLSWPLLALSVGLLSLSPRSAGAWAIGSQLDNVGCHEPITAEALRIARSHHDTAPPIVPTRDERALIDDVLFEPPADFVGDLAGMTLLLGVRDNDLKGIDPLSSLDLIQVHGDPETQNEHCIRGPSDDGADGPILALDACRLFIRDTALAALDGLDANGAVDPSIRVPFEVYVGLAGKVAPELPLFYIKMGAALHAFEDGFAHTYRTEDGSAVTGVLNWVDLVGTSYDEARDGAPHRAELDRCWEPDAVLARNYELSVLAAGELMTVALDPTLTREQKSLAFDEVTLRHLTFQTGCSFENAWCEPAEARVTSTILGCSSSTGSWSALVVFAILLLWFVRRRLVAGSMVALVLVIAAPKLAAADDPAAPPAEPVLAAPTEPVLALPADPAAPTTEPNRDMPVITAAEVKSVRADKALGSRFGFTVSGGASINRGALVGTIGGRYRINEKWLVGIDAGWNPWITTAPLKQRAGVAVAYATLIRRFPMRFDRVNLRSSLHVGVSTLLFDVYGAPQYSTGAYLAISPLGIDYDLGKHVRLVVDPVEFAVPIPVLGQIPLYYEQVRFMIGLQFGA